MRPPPPSGPRSYDRDWPRIRSFFGPESIYYDVPTGPSTAGVGPDSIEARLRLGLEGLAGYEHRPGVVAEGPDGVVVTEHTEVWTWVSGETVALPFVSVQRIEDGVIVLWKDYWDLQTLMSAAPPALARATRHRRPVLGGRRHRPSLTAT